MKFVRIIFITVASAMLAWTSSSSAQEFPSRPIHLIVAFVPGGAVDAVARKLGVALSENLGQQVVVENRPGASGSIGSEYVTKAPADGYTLLFAPSTLVANPLVMKTKPPFDVEHDLTPIAMVASGPLLMLVPLSGPATVREFVARAKARPDQVNFGTGGFGAAGHLSAEYFKLQSGINNVPLVLYRGTAPALTDLIGGQLSAMMEPTLSAMPALHGGKVRALAITASKRDPLFPDVPTFAEAGFPDMQFSTWYGVWAPAGMPAAVKQRLIDAQKAALGSPAMKDWLAQQGYEASPLSGEAFDAFVQRESARYERIVREGNIQPQ